MLRKLCRQDKELLQSPGRESRVASLGPRRKVLENNINVLSLFVNKWKENMGSIDAVKHRIDFTQIAVRFALLFIKTDPNLTKF